jgi:hypothetical protein
MIGSQGINFSHCQRGKQYLRSLLHNSKISAYRLCLAKTIKHPKELGMFKKPALAKAQGPPAAFSALPVERFVLAHSGWAGKTAGLSERSLLLLIIHGKWQSQSALKGFRIIQQPPIGK